MFGERTDLEERADTGRTVGERFEKRVVITAPRGVHSKLRRLLEIVNRDDDLYGLWLATNVNAMERLGMTDHGPVHVKIVMNLALQILRLLVEREVEPAAVKNYGLEVADAEVVVAMAALLHDLGMSIHRPDHESYSLFLAEQKLKEMLPEVYDARTAAIVRSEILHAIISHRSEGRPLTLEAGVVRIADALDMAEGRSRIPFEKGSQSIHSISAAAIDGVRIEAGKEKPVRVRVQMTRQRQQARADEAAARRDAHLEKALEILQEQARKPASIPQVIVPVQGTILATGFGFSSPVFPSGTWDNLVGRVPGSFLPLR